MLKTFALGGVHPQEYKLSASVAIKNFECQEKTVLIPLSQNLGAPSKSVVAKGDKVMVGTLLAEAGGFVSSPIHSPFSGTVFNITSEICDATGIRKPCITLQIEGDEWLPEIDRSDTLVENITLSSEEIRQKIAKAGIVGLGGATFPTHVKLALPEGKKAEFLLVNAVECEPYLTSDHQLMLQKGEEILLGSTLLGRALNVNKIFIGIENNKKDAIQHLSNLSKKYSNITVVPLKVKYPQGGEKQLIKAIVKREVPSGGLPIDVGCVVQNVATTFAVYEAVQKNKPLIERVVTVTGKTLQNPANYRVRIGTPIRKLIEQSGGLHDDTGKVILGGPMMGKATANVDLPVTKGISGILLLNVQESKRLPAMPCIRCAKCSGACPMGLEPYLLAKLMKLGKTDVLQHNHAQDCIECGCCQYTCPSAIPLLDFVRLSRMEALKQIREQKK